MRYSPFAISSLMLASSAALAQDAVLDKPVALQADGVTIDVGKDIGHAGPQLLDYDEDGKTDLLVSSFRGTIEFFRNVGTNDEPSYQTKGKLKLAGDAATDLKFHNW